MKTDSSIPPQIPLQIRLHDYSWLERVTGVGRGTLASMVSRGQLPHVRLGPRLVRFDENVIEQWLTTRSQAVTAEMAERRKRR